MNSELTLVNPALPVSYFLSSTDLTDAVIFAKPSVPLYKVTSDAKHMKICDGAQPNHIIADFHHRDILSDTISFPSRRSTGGSAKSRTGKGMNIKRWLKQFKMPSGRTMFTVDTDYGPYIWKMTSRHHHDVFAHDDLENAIASCYLHQSLPPNQPALILQPAGEPLRDDIVVAYLVQRYRMTLKSRPSVPSSMPRRSQSCISTMFPVRVIPGAMFVPNICLFSASLDYRVVGSPR